MTTYEVNESNFSAEVLEGDKPTLVDFWAPWCGPCLQFAPVFENLSEETQELKFVKVNVDNNPGLASEYGIRSIPTLVLFHKGRVVNTLMGPQSASKVKEKFPEHFQQ